MGKEYRAKAFKSGNSMALRLPKAIGFADGDEVVLVPHADGRFSMYKAGDALDVFMALPGSFSPGFMADGRGDIEQPERDWSSGNDAAAA